MIIAAIFILLMGGLASLLGRVLPFRICPVCVGVSGSWILLSLGVLTGYLLFAEYQTVVALLMGGTVVGLAYQGRRESPLFRFPVIVGGFGLVYWLVNHLTWLTFGIELILLIFAGYVYFVRPARKPARAETSDRTKQLEEKLKNCC